MLTNNEMAELTKRLREELAQEALIDEQVDTLDAEIESIDETHKKLMEVLTTFIPEKGDGKIVVDTLREWMDWSHRAQRGDRLVRRHQLRAYDVDRLDELTGQEQRDGLLWNRVDGTALLEWGKGIPVERSEEPAPKPAETSDFTGLTPWLVIGNISLTIAAIILATMK